MRRYSKLVAIISAVATIVTGIQLPVSATEIDNQVDAIVNDAAPEDYANKYADEGYHLAWNDEFNSESLDRYVWNVEEHEAGWVNSELQEYVDSSENIKVEGGNLNIIPKRE